MRLSKAVFAICAFLSWANTSTLGQPVKTGSSGHGKRVALTINYQPVAVLRARGGSSASERVEVALRRLAGLARSGRAVHFSAGRGSGGWAVMANGGVIIVAGSSDAKPMKMKRRSLARRWASAFARAWSLPLLTLNEGSTTVPAGAVRSLRIGGVGRGAIKVAVEPSGIVSPRLKGGAISLRGVTPGHGYLTVRRDGAMVTRAFRVMKWAGAAHLVGLEVTGSAVPRDLLATLIGTEASRGARLEPGAFAVMESLPILPQVWTRGSTLRSSLGVRMAGPGYLPVATRIPLEFYRRALPPAPKVELFYSNHPESVDAPQILFRHAIGRSTSARLLYHHQNAAKGPLIFAVDLRNLGDRAARVQIVDAAADPAVDTVYVGHQAAFKFFKRTKAGAGIIVTVPAHGRRRLFDRRVGEGETASGIIVVRPLGGGSLSLTTMAEAVDDKTPGSGAKKEADTVWMAPDLKVDAAYTVGGEWTYIPIGQQPVSNGAGLKLDGNYGVLYTVRLRLVNPTATRSSVKVFFEPRAGEARAAMLVEGSLRETGRAIPPAEVPMATFTLAPHQTRTVTLVTMPAAGGSYPAALIVHA
ncbi:MAG TPA: hypothetical protein VGM51_12845 [Armatimonadota bacterium]|jgi:hypothetical protein